jgi:hypothetical protein
MLVLNYPAGHSCFSVVKLDYTAVEGVAVGDFYAEEQIGEADVQGEL